MLLLNRRLVDRLERAMFLEKSVYIGYFFLALDVIRKNALSSGCRALNGPNGFQLVPFDRNVIKTPLLRQGY